MGTRRTYGVMVVLGITAVLVCAGACILADPPAEVPVPPIQHPEIERELVVPPVTEILRTWPIEFDVPINAFDGVSSIQWEAFLDYDVSQTPENSGTLDPDPAKEAGLRLLTARLPAPVRVDDCHTLEILVARSFVQPHVPDAYGADSVTWLYSPTGSLDGCAFYDAGPGDASPDGETEGGDPDGGNH
jgi:hypothetical protein